MPIGRLAISARWKYTNGCFVYCNGNTDKKAFDGQLEFDVKIIPCEGDTSWVEETILKAIECFKSDKLPIPALIVISANIGEP